ncbi:TetR family transcriptional regulator [Prauserella marina]|uniref:Regulatory protein, tetR family n=1 Tax=Prauserella marina TaxID=530584 RepID=A0A222VPN0_9PSEU|nr:TetR/AcrR family transcriptional regulator [Prauserella marina]ASR35879.1 TetR family transcriptional regulator [Prauserella marina]PWV84201.1 TetR family transcriptional regulator [Prauserella marina]SDC28186.1 regulatory protein, tetR family [Prauserella marina]
MPRTVDHAERRSMIISALLRIAGRNGLHTVTLRGVAAEAGVSLRLVQYYFHTKERLLAGTLDQLERDSRSRWDARLAAVPEPRTTRATIETLLAEALPADEPSRTFHMVWTSYAVLAMTDRTLAAQPFVAGPNLLREQLTALFDTARAAGELPEQGDSAKEASRLLALTHGLGTSVLVGQHSAAEAADVLRYHLDGLFGHDTHP